MKIFFRKYLQVQILYVTLHPRLRNKPNTATSGAVVQLVRIRACHARGRGFEPLPHRQVPLMKMRGICRIWGFAVLQVHSYCVRSLSGTTFVGDNAKFRVRGKAGFKDMHFRP